MSLIEADRLSDRSEIQPTAAPRPGPTVALRLLGVRKSFGKVEAVAGIDLTVEEGQFFTLLGPSGSGKTTLLRLIAGFETPDAGHIELGGRDVTFVPPYARQTNTVFQDYALFPHMTVAENVEYGLRVKKFPRPERERRRRQALERVQLGVFGNRKPAQLSGGQRQRVALARALVNQPSLLLLDEPLGALDLKLRQEMQLFLKRVQKEVGITFIYVTHDQEEALTMSDRIAVVDHGRIEQVGTPIEVYERPATEFVAGFIGTSNIIEREGRRITIRPEKIRLLGQDEDTAPGAHVERGVIREVVYVGMVTRYVVDLDDGGELVAIRQNFEGAEEALGSHGQRIRLAWRPDQSSLVGRRPEDAEGGEEG